MTLTEAGILFQKRTAQILDSYDDVCDQVRMKQKGAHGVLRLTTSVAFAEFVVVPLLSEFRSLYPGLQLELIVSDANIDLIADRIDLAIRLAPRVQGEFVVSQLFKTHYIVCASPSYLAANKSIVHPSDLRAHNCISYTLPGFRSIWRFRTAKEEFEVNIKGGISVSSALSLRSITINAEGVALLADWLIKNDLETGALVNVFPQYEVTATTYDTAAWLVYPSKSYLPSRVRIMVDFLKDKFQGQSKD